ncbi:MULTISPECIES: response regulator transcription factor [Bacillus]|jgi:DNA-binding response OmpR family regulator|uniref:DNA-binding response regulator n=1 Tax=Bacillus thuringiensis serovar navarrensis TaxID=339658 RepID=A0A243AL49_BACTU|nr:MULTISPECIES: response regulator transcription factor [Bacillus cereus group]MBJ7996665.1 response regulator transcription factor [Bacillus cereus]RAN87526.1 DNA-binding response regulator [Bacillus sp. SRB_28]MED1406123.1 response regulator transcription factor [Bacillus mycoides]OTY22987.1 DNA-binding response regulator [Bacillus thuringiensis serovar navarrensis]QWH84886.1 response regulator transcription factor [Bacillus mycoides]
MQRTILIVEDEDILREIMKDYLLNEGYNVLEAIDGKEALSIFEEHEVHLIILDIMLPELDGWAVCRRIRKKSNVPIIMLTARVDEDDTLLGFELGADDYVTKPYSPPILLARAKRLIESRYSSTVNVSTADTLTSSGIHVHFPSRTVTVDGEDISMTHTEFEILTYFMQNQGIVISREQLITKIWGYEFAGDDRTVNSHIRNLRHKLGQKATCIVTVVRAGYKFEGQV